MSSEYGPLFPAEDSDPGSGDLARVREEFQAASQAYLRSPWSWMVWALVLPGAALATPWILESFGPRGVLLTWAGGVLLGGAVEIWAIRRGRERANASPLAAWVLRVQGNLSLVATLLSLVLLWQGLPWLLPGLWLLLLGHSFYLVGGLAFQPFRLYGLLYQVGGLVALWPGGKPLLVFALVTGLGNLGMAVAVWRRRARAIPEAGRVDPAGWGKSTRS